MEGSFDNTLTVHESGSERPVMQEVLQALKSSLCSSAESVSFVSVGFNLDLVDRAPKTPLAIYKHLS